MTRTEYGASAVTQVRKWLRSNGIYAREMPYRGPYDLLTTKGFRVEVKSAKPRKHRNSQLVWSFNIHRHGSVDKTNVDFYLFQLVDVPGRTFSWFLTVPASVVKDKVAIVTLYALASGKYSGYFGKAGAMQLKG